ncbi:hypothetical protein [Martelella alba]|nr:hypothetical protein [Martelella alba]
MKEPLLVLDEALAWEDRLAVCNDDAELWTLEKPGGALERGMVRDGPG